MKDDKQVVPARPVVVTKSSPLKIKTRLRAGSGGGDRLFDSQNNANGFWDED